MPADAVDSITAHGEPSAEPQIGDIYINLDKIIYHRTINLGGLIRLEDGIEMCLNPEWYDKFLHRVAPETFAGL